MNIVCDGKYEEEQLDEAFNTNIENIKKTGKEIEAQYSTDGELKNRQAIIKFEQDGKKNTSISSI